MSGRFVRASKYRHVFGQAAKRELSYENLKVTKNAWDSNLIKCNGKYLSVNWESSGGGAFAVIPLTEVGKAPDTVPLCRGHTAAVLDTDWNPFDSQKLVSASDDGKIALWEIPEDYSFTHASGDEVQDLKPYGFLIGHSRKVGHVQFHPIAENVLASSSLDYTVKIWNVETQKCEVTLPHKDLVTSFCFNYNGTLLATTSRDKKIRVWDIVKGELVSEGPGHTGAKASRVCWLGNTDRILTTGFDRYSERQLCIWDAKAIDKGSLIGEYSVDTSSGTLMPFYDDATKLLFIAGKGDGNIRYFEFDEEACDIFEVSEYQSILPQRGFAIAPKRFVNVKENEVIRAYKTLNDNSVEPISFTVPRRSEMFQDDIYPDCPSDKPALTAEEFFGGKTVDGPLLMTMRDLYEGSEPTIVPSKPKSEIKKETTPAPAPAPVKKESPKEPVAPKEATPVPAFAKSGDLDDLKNKDEVNSLLDKVNSLSDNEEVNNVSDDENEEWDAPAKKEVTKKVVKESSPAPTPVTKEPTPAPTPVSSAPVKEEPKPEPKVESKTAPKEEVKASVVSEPASTATAKPAVGGGLAALKGTVDKLTTLVDKLESTITALTQANLDKDERLASLEAKIEELLKK